MRFALLATVAATGLAAFANMAAADNDELKCTSAAQSAWMSQDATKDLLKQQGYQDVRKIKVDREATATRSTRSMRRARRSRSNLDPTNGSLVAKED